MDAASTGIQAISSSEMKYIVLWSHNKPFYILCVNITNTIIFPNPPRITVSS